MNKSIFKQDKRYSLNFAEIQLPLKQDIDEAILSQCY